MFLHRAVTVCLIALSTLVSTASLHSRAKDACSQIAKGSSDQVFLPGTQTYNEESQAYWSLAAWLHPSCVFAPKDAQTLAAGVKILAATNTTFAVRSGGHAPITGLANTNHGVLIATTYFQTLEVVESSDKFGVPYARMGAGIRWGHLYDFLSTKGRISMGGRLYTVGAGAALGGGMSYLSQQQGWIANSIVNYELVTAAGEVLQVNNATHPDLYWALKGGGNNYGIVTRIDLRTWEEKPIYGANIGFANDDVPQFAEALTAWMLPGGGHEDPKGSIMPSTRYYPMNKTMDAAFIGYYDGNQEMPKAFENFTTTPHADLGFTGIQTLHSLVDETEKYYGDRILRQVWNWCSTSIKFSSATMDIILKNMIAKADELLPGLNGFVGVAEEPVTPDYLAAARRNGGDPMDLDPADGGFIIANYYVAYSDPALDAQAAKYIEQLTKLVEVEAKKINLLYPFHWLNTNGAAEEVFTLYGKGKSLPRMKKIAQKYDPKGVFQKLEFGYKLWGTNLGI